MKLHEAYEHLPTATKIGLDMTSLGLIVGTLADHLPAMAAALSVVWSCIRIYETKTVGRLLGRIETPRNSD